MWIWICERLANSAMDDLEEQIWSMSSSKMGSSSTMKRWLHWMKGWLGCHQEPRTAIGLNTIEHHTIHDHTVWSVWSMWRWSVVISVCLSYQARNPIQLRKQGIRIILSPRHHHHQMPRGFSSVQFALLMVGICLFFICFTLISTICTYGTQEEKIPGILGNMFSNYYNCEVVYHSNTLLSGWSSKYGSSTMGYATYSGAGCSPPRCSEVSSWLETCVQSTAQGAVNETACRTSTADACETVDHRGTFAAQVSVIFGIFDGYCHY